MLLILTACGGGEGSGGVDEANQDPNQTTNTNEPNSNTDTNTTISETTVESYTAVKGNISACIACHKVGGIAGSTPLILELNNDLANIAAFKDYILNFGSAKLLSKSIGQPFHSGGAVFGNINSQVYKNFAAFLLSLEATSSTPPSADGFTIESASKTYRRASLYLTGNIPSRDKVLSMQGASDSTLRNEIMALMTGDGFRNFLKNGANARLNSRHLLANSNAVGVYNKYYLPNVSSSENRNVVRRDLAEEPLEIIANVVMTNRPYSEILTANYTMVSQYTDESFNTGLNLAPGVWNMAQNKGQDAKTPATFFADATGATRINNYPHAGVLSTWSYLSKYGTTATNRNRARARWTMYHFLGFDIEKSAARAIAITDVADEDNPTMNNPACTVCHTTLDPVAGAFKFFHERIAYKASGTDSLDRRYRSRNPGVDWYQDMLPAGYNNLTATGDPLQWLAQRIVEDNRFATAAVKFWWLAIFGEDVLTDSAPRLQFDTQQTLITSLADSFRPNLNLKLLLANMMLSNNFRAERKTDSAQADNTVNIHMGARRLLTGTELKNKTASLTNITWGNSNPRLEREFKLLYGGKDDFTITKRATDLSSIMFRVAERHANEISCAVVVFDFSLAQANRRLFTQVERTTLNEASIRNQIVVLYERMLNRLVTSDSAVVNQAYQLFLDLRQARINAGGGTRIDANTRCDNRIGGSLDDSSFVLTPWRGLIVALMSDPDYLYE